MEKAIDEDLARRLREVGVDPCAPGDPRDAWLRLHGRHGARATLLDRYALEAAARKVHADGLDSSLRSRLTLEVLQTHNPGFEVVTGSSRLGTDPVEVVPYDPGWPERFARWRERLAARLDAAPVRIEHIGSTAVPGQGRFPRRVPLAYRGPSTSISCC